MLIASWDYVKGWEYYEVRFENEDFAHVKIPTSGSALGVWPIRPAQASPVVVWSSKVWEMPFSLVVTFISWKQQNSFLFLTRPSLLTLFRDWFDLGDRVQEFVTDPSNDDRPHIALMSLPQFSGLTSIHSASLSLFYQ